MQKVWGHRYNEDEVSCMYLAWPCAPPKTSGQHNLEAYHNGTKVPNYKEGPYKVTCVPFVQSSFAVAENDQQILLEVQKQVTSLLSVQWFSPSIYPSDEEDIGEQLSVVSQNLINEFPLHTLHAFSSRRY